MLVLGRVLSNRLKTVLLLSCVCLGWEMESGR